MLAKNIQGRVFSLLKDHGSTILTGMAVVGVVAVAISSSKDAIKAKEVIEEKEREYGELSTKEKIVASIPSYIPTIAFTTGTIICVVSSTVLDRKRIASIAGAYVLLKKSYDEYRQKVRDIYGEDTDEIIKKAIICDHALEQKKKEPANNEIKTFYIEQYGKMFERSMIEVVSAEAELNRLLVKNGEVSLNDFYDLLGLDRVPEAEALGWNQDFGFDFNEFTWIDFEHELITLEDGMECYVIKPSYEPEFGYDDWMRNNF